MKAAVIGLGAMGKNHVRVYKDMGILSGVCDSDLTTLTKISSQYSVPRHDDIWSLIKDNKPDLVSIVVPTQYHFDVAAICLDAGIDILIEKPICPTLDLAGDLVERHKTRYPNRICTVGYIERFNPAVQKLKSLIQDKSLGDITTISIKRVGGQPRSAGNVVIDLMTHDIDLLLYLIGEEPIEISRATLQTDSLVRSGYAILKFNETIATCEANWVSPIKIRQIHVTGTKGYIQLDLIKQELIQFTGLNDSCTHILQDVEIFKGEPLVEEIKAFVKAVETRNTENLVSLEDAMRTLRLTLQCAYD